MDDRKIKLQLGIVGATVVAATIFLIVIFGQGKLPSLFSNDYTIYVLLPQAPMLTPNSPVSKNGVEIGHVIEVALAEDDHNVKITARINGEVKLFENDECRLNMNILGQSALNFLPKPGEVRGEILKEGSTINGVAPLDIVQIATNLEGDLTGALHQFTAATKAVSDTFKKVDQIIGTPEEVNIKQKRLEEIVAQVSSTMGSIERLSKGVEDIINDPNIKKSIQTSSAELPQLITDVKALMSNVDSMVVELKTTFGRVEGTFDKVDKNLDNVAKFTGALGENGPQFIDKLSETVAELESTIHQLHDFTESLNNPDGSIGQMLNDPEFFQSLSRTVKNAERLTQQLQPVMRDVNVFSDKIARNPGLLGLQGLFDKNPPVKGIPSAYPNSINVNQTYNDEQPRERVQWNRTTRSKIWPYGWQRFRNEIVPQNRYASLVEDRSPYGESFDDQSRYHDESSIVQASYNEGPGTQVLYNEGRSTRVLYDENAGTQTLYDEHFSGQMPFNENVYEPVGNELSAYDYNSNEEKALVSQDGSAMSRNRFSTTQNSLIASQNRDAAQQTPMVSQRYYAVPSSLAGYQQNVQASAHYVSSAPVVVSHVIPSYQPIQLASRQGITNQAAISQAIEIDFTPAPAPLHRINDNNGYNNVVLAQNSEMHSQNNIVQASVMLPVSTAMTSVTPAAIPVMTPVTTTTSLSASPASLPAASTSLDVPIYAPAK